MAFQRLLKVVVILDLLTLILTIFIDGFKDNYRSISVLLTPMVFLIGDGFLECYTKIVVKREKTALVLVCLRKT